MQILRRLTFYLNFVYVINCYDNNKARKYNEVEFNDEISKNPHFVKFFAPWCGHCKRLAPTWDELAEKFNVEPDKQKVVIAKVDCTLETALCADQGVTGYPTLKFFKPGANSEGQKYRGARDLTSLEAFIDETLGATEEDQKVKIPEEKQELLELTDETFVKITSHGQHFIKFYAPWCGHCQKLAPVWADLAKTFEYDRSVTISKIDCTAHRQACNEYEVKAYPTLLWLVDGKKVERYQGGRALEELKSFVNQMKEQHDDELKHLEDGRVPTRLAADEVTPVVELSSGNFDNAIEKGVTFVKFYAPWCGHCQRLAPTWNELSRKFISNTNVKIAKIDCTVHTDMCEEFKVEGYPTLILFKNGLKIAEFKGSRDLDALYDFVVTHLQHDEL